MSSHRSGEKSGGLALRLAAITALGTLPVVVLLVDIHSAALAGCGPYGYDCTDPVCLAVEVTRDQGSSWEAGSVWLYGAPGAEIFIHVRTILRTNVSGVEGWSFGLEHDASNLVASGGEFELWSVVEGSDLATIQDGSAPDFSVTKGWDCGATQGVVIDMDASGHTLDPQSAGSIVPVLLCYRLKFGSSEWNFQDVTLSFSDNVGSDPKVATVVTQDGQSLDPCRVDLTLHVFADSTTSPTPSYCPYSQTQVEACGGAQGGGGAGIVSAFIRGDANPGNKADGAANISDVVAIVSYLFLGGEAPGCEKAADADDNGRLQITDAIYLASFLFLGSNAPPAPYPECGPDPTEDSLGCATYSPCVRPGLNVSQSPEHDQMETAIAINPTSPENVVVVSNHRPQDQLGGLGLFRGASSDGGANWPAASVVMERLAETANVDPSIAFDEFGNLYVAYIARKDERLHVAISVDGGATFPPALNTVVVDHCVGPREFVRVDRPTIATGPSVSGGQSVWVTALQRFRAPDRVIAAGAEVTGLLVPGGPPPAFTLYEVDECLCSFGDIAVGPRGEVLVTYQEVIPQETLCPERTNILLKIRDPARPGQSAVGFRYPTQMPIATTNLCGTIKGGQHFAAGDSVWGLPHLEWDRAANLAYLTYKREPQDTPNDSFQPIDPLDTDTYLRVGIGPHFAAWSEPVIVADTAGVQVLHDSSLDPVSGELAVSFYGSTSAGNLDDPAGETLRYFATYSRGVGGGFKSCFAVSTCDSAKTAIGNDYTAIAFRDGAFFPSWGEKCDGASHFDVFVNPLAVEDCGDGVDNDGDGLTDCADPFCCGAPCAPCEDCSNRVDDDDDGLTDCADPDCATACAETCDNGADDDGDGLIDCDDPECCGEAGCAPCEEFCDDGVDDDGDGLIDCQDSDCDQACAENCTNGVDDDGDGLVDCADFDCEPYCGEDCNDAIDNDADGLVDCADPECPGVCAEICDDRVDNDWDGLVDLDDPDCGGEDCTNGTDDDGDGLIDCDDPECCGQNGCDPCVLREDCADGEDNDGDGAIDCLDPDCALVPVCQELCGDGLDNDVDGLADCDDPECCGQPGCGPCEDCQSGIDDDGDGLADCDDPDCAEACACADGVDNDGDGLTDCADADCDGAAACREDCATPGDQDGDCRDDCIDPDCAAGLAEVCDDRVDNDGDGAIDCLDADCGGCAFCPENCGNGMNDDMDALVDCMDPDCELYCAEDCADGVDNDNDGEVDCADHECFRHTACPEICNDTFDNDGDGDTDCEDSECPPCQ